MKPLRTKMFMNEIYLINGFGWASPGFSSDPSTASDQARGSIHFIMVSEPRFRRLWKKALNNFVKGF